MTERILIAGVVIALSVLGWLVINWLAVRRLAKVAPVDPLLADLEPGVPAIVYFTTPFCIPCRTLQKPALASLQTELGKSIQIIQVDSDDRPEVADRWGVFSAPTTFILDRNHQPRTVNRGVASVETLKRQLQAVV